MDMTRATRVDFPGAWYHVFESGNRTMDDLPCKTLL